MNRRVRTMDEEWGPRGQGVARWILPALLVSLALHVLFVLWARGFPVERLSDAFYDRIVPRTFHLERVEVDPKLLEPTPDDQKAAASAPVPVRLPEEKVSFEKMMGEVRATPTAPKLEAEKFADKPTVEALSFENTMQTAEAAGVRSLLPDDKALVEQLLQDKPLVSGATAIDLPNPETLGGAPTAQSGTAGGQAGFSDLDDLLAQTGPLSPETAPILMPTDLLFDYGSAELRPEAAASLQKLGELIRRNPNSRFVIEGHTDSFGTDEYNNTLSLERAETVKAFLTATMAIPPAAISARGLGRSRLIAPASGTIEQQQINRRVEIVIRAPAQP